MLESGQVYILLGTFALIFILQKFSAFRQEERAIGCVRWQFYGQYYWLTESNGRQQVLAWPSDDFQRPLALASLPGEVDYPRDTVAILHQL